MKAGEARRVHGRRKGRKRRVISFLKPCLLVILHQKPAHGYSLLNGLNEFGFDPERLDPSLVYRVLRELETVDLVSSEWDTNSLGPQRRVYEITPEGKKHLAEWIQDLHRTRKEIEALEAAYEQVGIRN